MVMLKILPREGLAKESSVLLLANLLLALP
jgi:hypothetical protein